MNNSINLIISHFFSKLFQLGQQTEHRHPIVSCGLFVFDWTLLFNVIILHLLDRSNKFLILNLIYFILWWIADDCCINNIFNYFIKLRNKVATATVHQRAILRLVHSMHAFPNTFHFWYVFFLKNSPFSFVIS